jgi:hypothetical protein
MIIKDRVPPIRMNIHASGPNGRPILWKKSEMGLNNSTMDLAKFE